MMEVMVMIFQIVQVVLSHQSVSPVQLEQCEVIVV